MRRSGNISSKTSSNFQVEREPVYRAPIGNKCRPADPALHLTAPIIQQQNVPQQRTIAQPEESLQHGLANGNAGGAPHSDAGPNPPGLWSKSTPSQYDLQVLCTGDLQTRETWSQLSVQSPTYVQIIYQKWCKGMQAWPIMQFLSPTPLPSISPP